mgnify:FL=1
MKNMAKKGISPVIATVLLIAIVVVLIVIIFIWAKSFIGETVQKKGSPADQSCDEVALDIAYDGSELQVTNRGNIYVYRVEVKKKGEGSVERQTIDERLGIGQSISNSIGSGYNDIEVIPVILGEAKTSKTLYTCKNGYRAEIV